MDTAYKTTSEAVSNNMPTIRYVQLRLMTLIPIQKIKDLEYYQQLLAESDVSNEGRNTLIEGGSQAKRFIELYKQSIENVVEG